MSRGVVGSAAVSKVTARYLAMADTDTGVADDDVVLAPVPLEIKGILGTVDGVAGVACLDIPIAGNADDAATATGALAVRWIQVYASRFQGMPPGLENTTSMVIEGCCTLRK